MMSKDKTSSQLSPLTVNITTSAHPLLQQQNHQLAMVEYVPKATSKKLKKTYWEQQDI